MWTMKIAPIMIVASYVTRVIDGHRMGICWTSDPAGKARRRQAQGEHTRGGEWPYACPVDRLSVACDADELSAEKHGLRLF